MLPDRLVSVVPRETGETLDPWDPEGRRVRGEEQGRGAMWALQDLLAGLVSKGRWGRREWDFLVEKEKHRIHMAFFCCPRSCGG